MADLATLSLAIDSRSAVEATSAIDKMGEAAVRGEGRVKQILTATDSLVAALNRNSTATAALTGRMDQMQAAGAKATDAIKAIGTSAGTAGTSVMDLAQNIEKTGTAATTSARAIDASATSAQKHVATTAQVAAATAKATTAHNDNARAVGLSANELRNLSFQLNDVATMALSGASAFQIAATQGGQLLQIGQMAGGGIKGILTQAGEAASGLAGRIGLVGASLGAVTLGLATAAAAAASYRAEQKELERSTFGVGRASGATLQTLQDAAAAGSANGTISTSASRDVIGQLNATGKIDPRVYADVAANSRDLAKVLGTDIPTAAETVTSALAGGVQGFDKLNATLGLGGAALREQVKDLYESGKAYEAQRLIVDAYAKRVAEVTEKPGAVQSFLNRFSDFGKNTSDEFSAIGSVFRKRTPEENLASARSALGNKQSQVDAGLAPASSLDAARANVEKLEASIARTVAGSRDAKTALTSLTVQPLIESLNPAQKRINDLRTSAEGIDTFLKEGGDKLDQNGTARRTMEGLRDQAKQLADDLTRGGTGLSNSLRDAQFSLRTVGLTDTARGDATIRQRAANEIEALKAQNPESAARDAQVKTVNDRMAVELEAARQQTVLSISSTGGALSRLSTEVRDQFLRAGTDPRYGRIPIGIAAAITSPESGGNLDVGFSKSRGEDGRTSSAYGLGQITRGTAQEAARGGYLPQDYDRTNRDTMAQGILGVLSMKLDQNGGNLDKAIMAYRGSKDPQVNLSYLAEVKRNAGEAGDATVGGQARDVDANARALKQANDNLRLNTELYGRNGAQLEAQTRATDQYNQLLARGVPATEAASIAFSGLADKLISVERAGRVVQFTRDDDFARDQLGRGRVDQQAYATARSRFGDTTSPEATSLINRARDTASLQDARGTVTDALTGFASDIRRGTKPMEAFTNAFGRITDRLTSTALDSLVAGAFRSGGSGGGIMSLFGGGSNAVSTGGISPIPGFDDGGFTGQGGRLDPAGVVHRGEVVWSQTDVARYGGPHVVDRMRRGLAGYAAGGLAGWASSNPPANSNAAMPSINFITPPGTALEADGPPQRRADGGFDQVLRTMESGLGKRARNSQGPFGQSAGGAWSRTG